MNPDTPDSQPPTSSQTPEVTRSPKNSMKRILIAITVVFVLLITAYAITASMSKNKTTTPTNTKIETAAVSITSSGFEPATIQIKPDTQVTWTNTDTADHQVAADPYPKNDSIPGFHSGVIIQKGDTISFIFTKAGTYSYHDEKKPMDLKGTVVVK